MIMRCNVRARWAARGALGAALSLVVAMAGQARAEECLTYRTEKCPDKPNIPEWHGKGPDPLLAPPTTPVQKVTGKGRSKAGTRGGGKEGGSEAPKDPPKDHVAPQQTTTPMPQPVLGTTTTPPPPEPPPWPVRTPPPRPEKKATPSWVWWTVGGSTAAIGLGLGLGLFFSKRGPEIPAEFGGPVDIRYGLRVTLRSR